MSIGKRVVRLVKADIHGILDCLEDPESILQQAIRDMEEEIATTEEELRSREEEGKNLNQARSQVEHGIEDTARQLDACFESQNEALSRTVIRKKLELDKRLKAVTQLQSENERRKEETRARLKDRQEKLVSIREKAELFASRESASGKSTNPEESWVISDEQVELAMIEERKKRALGKSR